MNGNHDFTVFARDLASLSKTGYFKVNLCDDSCYANEEWYSSFGAEPGMRIIDVLQQYPYIHPVDHYSLAAFLGNAKKGYERKYRGYMRIRVPGKDLTWRWYQVNMMITNYAPDIKMIELVGMQYEVTGLMGDSEQSMMEISKMTDLLQSFNTIPWTYDFRTRVIVSNRSFVSNNIDFNTISNQMSWDEFMQSVLPEYREGMQNFHDQMYLGTCACSSLEIKMHLGNEQKPVWVEFRAIIQECDEQGRAMTAIGTNTIIQERKMAELAMRDAQLKAEHANHVKTAFIANMSHEFRTPLNSILGFSTIMAHSDTMEERMQCLGAIQNGGSQLLHIIDDVLIYAQIEAEELQMKLCKVELRSLLERVVEECKPARKAGVEMNFTSSANEMFVLGDEAKIIIVAKHLIDNSIKYTDSGTISVEIDKQGNHAHIRITDTGHGMSSEALAHIYDRFYKGSEYIPGTGLGLSIVKRLVEMWKGEIKVESELGKGTTFTITVPMYSTLY